MASTEFYEKMGSLQDSIYQSEERRLQLDIQLRHKLSGDGSQDQAQLSRLQAHLKSIVENEARSAERNDKLLRDIDRVETHLDNLSARTEKLRRLKKQYEDYIDQLYPKWKQQMEAYLRRKKNGGKSPTEVPVRDFGISGDSRPSRFDSPRTARDTVGPTRDSRSASPGFSPKNLDGRSASPGLSPRMRDGRSESPGLSPRMRDSRSASPGLSPKMRDGRSASPGLSPRMRDSRSASPGLSPRIRDSRSRMSPNDVLEPPTSPRSSRISSSRVSGNYPDTNHSDVITSTIISVGRPMVDEQSSSMEGLAMRELREPLDTGRSHFTRVTDRSDTGRVSVEDGDFLSISVASRTQERPQVSADLALSQYDPSPRTSSILGGSDLTREGLIRLLSLVDTELKTSTSGRHFYRSSLPGDSVIKDIIAVANSKESLGHMNPVSVSMVVLDQLPSVSASLSQRALLTDACLEDILQEDFRDEELISRSLPEEKAQLWQRLLSHFKYLVRRGGMSPEDVGETFAACIIHPNSRMEAKVMTLLTDLVAEAAGEDSLTDDSFSTSAVLRPSAHSPEVRGTLPGGTRPSFDSLKATAGSFHEFNVTTNPELRMTDGHVKDSDAYQRMLGGSLTRQQSSLESEEEDLDALLSGSGGRIKTLPTVPEKDSPQHKSASSGQGSPRKGPAEMPTSSSVRSMQELLRSAGRDSDLSESEMDPVHSPTNAHTKSTTKKTEPGDDDFFDFYN